MPPGCTFAAPGLRAELDKTLGTRGVAVSGDDALAQIRGALEKGMGADGDGGPAQARGALDAGMDGEDSLFSSSHNTSEVHIKPRPQALPQDAAAAQVAARSKKVRQGAGMHTAVRLGTPGRASCTHAHLATYGLCHPDTHACTCMLFKNVAIIDRHTGTRACNLHARVHKQAHTPTSLGVRFQGVSFNVGGVDEGAEGADHDVERGMDGRRHVRGHGGHKPSFLRNLASSGSVSGWCAVW